MTDNKWLSKPTFVDILILLFLCLFCFSTLYPFVNLFFVSISDITEVVKNKGLMLFPSKINLEGYRYVFSFSNFMDAYKITIYITVVGTLINIALTVFGAYVLSNRDLPGRSTIMILIIITMFFGGGLIPNYLLVKSLGLVNTLWALMLPNAINAFLLILTRNFFQGIPNELRESARIDGCSELGVLFRMMLPLSLPIVATLVLFYGVGHWNEYVSVVLYIYDTKLSTLQFILRDMYVRSIEQLDGDVLPPPVDTVRAATVMVATLPIVCLYPFVQKYFIQGLMMGSLKG